MRGAHAEMRGFQGLPRISQKLISPGVAHPRIDRASTAHARFCIARTTL
jgi:hypothetical protein